MVSASFTISPQSYGEAGAVLALLFGSGRKQATDGGGYTYTWGQQDEDVIETTGEVVE